MEGNQKMKAAPDKTDRITETMKEMARDYTAGNDKVKVQKKAEMIGFVIALELCQANTVTVKEIFEKTVEK